MTRSYSLIVIAAAILAGCDKADRATSPQYGTGIITAPRAATQTLRGTVISNPTQEVLPQFALQLDDGTLIGLVGSGALPLASVLGAEVEVVGSTPTDLTISESAIEVDRFVVLSVGGSDVSDGVLELIADGVYALHLTTGGDREIVDREGALAGHIGERIWLAMTDDGASLKFGVIQA